MADRTLDHLPRTILVVSDSTSPNVSSSKVGLRESIYLQDLHESRASAHEDAQHRIACLASEREGDETFRAVVVTYTITKIEYVTGMPDGSVRITEAPANDG